MKATTAKKIKGLGMKVTSKEELNELYAGDPGSAADREFGAALPKMGRPKAGEKPQATIGKTVKHTEAFWRLMAKRAEERGLSLHEAMREALAEWVTPKTKRKGKAA